MIFYFVMQLHKKSMQDYAIKEKEKKEKEIINFL